MTGIVRKLTARLGQRKEMQASGRPATGVLRVPRLAALVTIAAAIAAASLTSFAESYRGLYDWAREHGLSGIWSAAWPLQLDTFIAVGELALFVALADRWTARSRIGAWAVTLLGLAASVAGNVGHVHSHLLTDRATAAVPPRPPLRSGSACSREWSRLTTRVHRDVHPGCSRRPHPGPLTRVHPGCAWRMHSHLPRTHPRSTARRTRGAPGGHPRSAPWTVPGVHPQVIPTPSCTTRPSSQRGAPRASGASALTCTSARTGPGRSGSTWTRSTAPRARIRPAVPSVGMHAFSRSAPAQSASRRRAA